MSAEQDLANANVQIANLITEVTRFRDAAMGLNNIHPTITEGRQNTDDGKYFSVPGNGAYMRLYRRQGATAELIAEFPDRAELNFVINQIGLILDRGVVGGAGPLLAEEAFGIGGQGYSLQNFDSPPLRNEFFYGSGDAVGDVPQGANFLPGLDLYRASSQRSARLIIGSDSIYADTWSGATKNARARMYSNKNVLGAVSLSGGAPTGGLIERGSNANGEYVKFADGTMICTGVVAVNLSIALAQTTASFAASFSSPPKTTLAGTSFTTSGTTSAALEGLRANPPSSSSVRVQAGVSTAGSTLDVEYIAIGRWN